MRNNMIFVGLVAGLALAFSLLACRALTGEVEPTPTLRSHSPTRTVPPLPSSPTPAAAVTQGSGPAGAETPLPATVEPEGRELVWADQAPALAAAFDASVLAQDLNEFILVVEIDFNAQQYTGRQQVTYTNREDQPLDALYFRLLPNGGNSYGNGSLVASSVQVDGQPVETALSVGDSALEVRLPQPLAVGETRVVTMDFAGRVPKDFGPGYGIFNFTDNSLALAGWYPLLAVYDHQGWNLDPVSSIGDSVYADMALYTVDVTVNAPVTLAASGSPVVEERGNTRTHYRYVTGPVREFFMVMSPDYQVLCDPVGETQVCSYFYPQDVRAGEAALQVAVDALAAFNETFGPYPYTELDVVEASMVYAAGVEFPGIVLIIKSEYRGGGGSFFTEVIAHEVAHQWWYNVVGNDVFDEPWLDEGLTTFSSGLYREAVEGPGAYNSQVNSWRGDYQWVVSNGQDDLVTASLDHFENNSQAGNYGAVVYSKGALFFAELRDEIGDEAFFAALQSYYETQQFQIATAEDLLAAFETAAGRQLDDFYEQWLYTRTD